MERLAKVYEDLSREFAMMAILLRKPCTQKIQFDDFKKEYDIRYHRCCQLLKERSKICAGF